MTILKHLYRKNFFIQMQDEQSHSNENDISKILSLFLQLQ